MRSTRAFLLGAGTAFLLDPRGQAQLALFFANICLAAVPLYAPELT